MIAGLARLLVFFARFWVGKKQSDKLKLWPSCRFSCMMKLNVRDAVEDDFRQGTTGQNRTKQTKAQKQEKQTKTNKALFTEQAADFGMWQQSRAAYAGRRQIHAIMESTSRSYCYQSPWQGTANLQLVRTHMCTPTVGENDEKYDHFKVTLTYKRPAEK